MRYLLTACILLGVWALFAVRGDYSKRTLLPTSVKKEVQAEKPVLFDKQALTDHAAKAKTFAEANDYCKRYCFLIDMSRPSGKKRFFVYDLQNDSILASGLVTHGSGSETGMDSLKFSNTVHSNATSLGKYRIGKSYYGKFGLAFKLHGLDASNNNAFARSVVLHAHPCVLNEEIWPGQICDSWGCPTVNPSFLQTLKKYIEDADKPVLLWIYHKKTPA